MIQNKRTSGMRRFTPQKFLNGEIHNWYRIVQGYEDHLVSNLLDRFGLQQGQKVLDPFCGTGTTLVECMKKGIDCTGIEANPSSLFAAKVKTRWNVKGDELLKLLSGIQKRQEKLLKHDITFTKDPTYVYLEKTGMIQRGWISPKPFRKAIAIKKLYC